LTTFRKVSRSNRTEHVIHYGDRYKFLHNFDRPDIIGLQPPVKVVHIPIGVLAGRDSGDTALDDIYRNIEAEIPRLRRYARALARDVVAADDLVQDCLARALGKLHLWNDGTDLRAWLFTILHNQYVNQVRRAVREGSAVGLNENEPLLMRAPHQGKRLELRDLERAIAKLPDEQRAVILLVGLEGMHYEEVAEVLGIPVGTVRSRLSRSREALRRLTGMVPDRQAELAMTDPAALGRGIVRFGGRAGPAPKPPQTTRIHAAQIAARTNKPVVRAANS
jgi:RNA polymerase sigma factor (sigma-70 family)